MAQREDQKIPGDRIGGVLLKEKAKDEFGRLLLGLQQGDGLKYVGQTDFGFNGDKLSEFLSRLSSP